MWSSTENIDHIHFTIYLPHLTLISQALCFLGDTDKASYSCSDWMGSTMGYQGVEEAVVVVGVSNSPGLTHWEC